MADDFDDLDPTAADAEAEALIGLIEAFGSELDALTAEIEAQQRTLDAMQAAQTACIEKWTAAVNTLRVQHRRIIRRANLGFDPGPEDEGDES